METGGKVWIDWTQHDGYLQLTVEDEGPGLPDTTNLFVPFFTTKPTGSGIGLALSRQIAEAHGGTLGLENRAGARDAARCCGCRCSWHSGNCSWQPPLLSSAPTLRCCHARFDALIWTIGVVMLTGGHLFVRIVFAFAFLLAGSRPVLGQTVEIVHAFKALPANPVGDLLELTPNVFIGASRGGGVDGHGTLYLLARRTDGTWTTFVMHSFSGPDGRAPAAGVIRARDGNFYGTTEGGGRFGKGTVFRMTPFGAFTTLHSFTDADGVSPTAPLVQAGDGVLWGSTPRYGSGGAGTIFEITTLGTFSRVHSFSGPNLRP